MCKATKCSQRTVVLCWRLVTGEMLTSSRDSLAVHLTSHSQCWASGRPARFHCLPRPRDGHCLRNPT